MRQSYVAFDEAWQDAAKIVLSSPKQDSRAGLTHERIGYSMRLVDPSHAWMTNTRRRLDPRFSAGEILWYLSGSQDIAGVVGYAPQYEKFAEEGKAHGAYGWRWETDPGFSAECRNWGITKVNQLDAVVRLLLDKPDTRQAVITMWNGGDLLHAMSGAHKDLPCTVCIQFLRRDGVLHACVYMRSNDLWLGMPYDVFAFTTIQRLIADAVGDKPGSYTHCVGSLHAYEKHWDAIDEAIQLYPSYHPMTAQTVKGDIATKIDWAVAYEKSVRLTGKFDVKEVIAALGVNVLSDLVLCAAAKWVHPAVAIDNCESSALREAMVNVTRKEQH